MPGAGPARAEHRGVWIRIAVAIVRAARRKEAAAGERGSEDGYRGFACAGTVLCDDSRVWRADGYGALCDVLFRRQEVEESAGAGGARRTVGYRGGRAACGLPPRGIRRGDRRVGRSAGGRRRGCVRVRRSVHEAGRAAVQPVLGRRRASTAMGTGDLVSRQERLQAGRSAAPGRGVS